MDEDEIRSALLWLVVGILNHKSDIDPTYPALLSPDLRQDVEDLVALFKDINNG